MICEVLTENMLTILQKENEELLLSYYEGQAWVRFSNKKATKYSALWQLCQSVGLSTDQVMAFGDDYNDVEMLTKCGIWVAVSNAIASAKAASNYDTADNNSDGVAFYIKEYFDKYIAELNPYAVVFEGCTVNDWLSGKTLAAYSADIERMIQLVNNCTQKLVMHTTFPVTGGIYYGDGINSYDEYVDTARRTAQKNGIPVADCYATAQKLILAVPIEKRNSFMHHDKWHPNGTGHYLYATTLLQYIIFVIK